MTRDEFQKFFEEWVLKAEGGYSNNKKDPGGETKYGISKKQYPKVDIKSLTKKDAADIYYRDYWMKYCENFAAPDSFKMILFDMYINHNPKSVAKVLQKTINTYRERNNLEKIAEDGIIGKQTIANTREFLIKNKEYFYDELLFERAFYYTSLASLFPTFGRGWIKERVLGLRKYIRSLKGV